MSIGRVLGLAALIVVLYAIITEPLTSAATAQSGGAAIGSASASVGAFASSLVAGGTLGNPSAASQAASTSTEVGPSYYRVRPGDTLSTIAEEHATSASRIAARNGLSDSNRIRPGQQLIVD